MTKYSIKPNRFLERIFYQDSNNPVSGVCCAGFELSAWRCKPFANHLIEWLPEYAMPEDELSVTHGNMYVKLQQAAIRIYSSPNYSKRGEVGEIALHAICRDYFQTIPISNRVFYKSTSNDVIKAFDMVHARLPEHGAVELWLGESKLYKSTSSAVSAAISSITEHLAGGFLKEQKLILGPQIPKSTPRYDELISLFAPQNSLDKLISSAVFVVGILSNSSACSSAKLADPAYVAAVQAELDEVTKKLSESGLPNKIRLCLIYVPLADKDALVKAFDTKLKALQ